MDDEDLADLEESRQLKTESTFAGLGPTAEDPVRRDTLMDLLRPSTGDTVGVKLLQKMGWRPGQGIGRKIRRKAKLSDGREEDGELHLFAPENSKMISFVKKDDYKGLGFTGEKATPKPRPAVARGGEDDDEDDGSLLARSKAKFTKAKAKPVKTSFGVGILNDTGSGDEDPYETGPKINVKRSIRPSNETSSVVKPKIKKLSANPAVSSRPTFKSASNLLKQSAARLRKCHDGKLPLKGFIISTMALDAMPVKSYPLPTIPGGWKSAKAFSNSSESSKGKQAWQSTSDAAKSSKLDPGSRGEILGEESLQGKSIFDYLTPEARAKMIAATGRTDLPTAKGEAPPGGNIKPEAERLWDMLPALDKAAAVSALQRAVSGFTPYAGDESKRGRYQQFLSLKAGLTSALPEKATGVSDDDWAKELREFAHAAQVFKPLTGLLASRFNSASKTLNTDKPSGDGDDNDDDDAEVSKFLRSAEPKPEDPAVQAARAGLYGPMTRSVQQFFPTRLLCKRFGVRPPAHVTSNAESGEISDASRVQQPVGLRDMERMRWLGRTNMPSSAPGASSGTGDALAGLELQLAAQAPSLATVDPERNEAIEGKRAGAEVFKAVFGNDDDG